MGRLSDKLDAFEDKIKEQQNDTYEEAYAKQKAESETNAMVDISTDTNKTLQLKLNQKLSNHIDTDPTVNEKIEETANKLVDKGLQVQTNKADASIIDSQSDINTADFKKNEAEYMYHGIDHPIDKDWKRKILHTINDIWFVIWAFVSFFTIVPVSTFLSRIKALKGIVKGVAIVLGILMLLACLAGLTLFCLRQCGVVR